MTATYVGTVIRWRVKDILDQHGLSVYALAERLQGRVNRNTLYQISRNATKRADLETIEALSDALTELTGKAIELGDLFERVDEVESQ